MIFPNNFAISDKTESIKSLKFSEFHRTISLIPKLY